MAAPGPVVDEAMKVAASGPVVAKKAMEVATALLDMHKPAVQKEWVSKRTARGQAQDTHKTQQKRRRTGKDFINNVWPPESFAEGNKLISLMEPEVKNYPEAPVMPDKEIGEQYKERVCVTCTLYSTISFTLYTISHTLYSTISRTLCNTLYNTYFLQYNILNFYNAQY